MNQPAPRSAFAQPQTARAALRVGDRFAMKARVRVTPLGLLAIGGLVSAILLSVPPIVRAAGQVRGARAGARSAERLQDDAKRLER